MNSNFVRNLLGSGNYVTVNKKIMMTIGSDEAITLSELLSRYWYFENREQLTKDGYFFNTFEDLSKSLPYSRTTQYRILNKLEDLGLIEQKVEDFPQKRYFKINFDAIGRLLSEGSDE